MTTIDLNASKEDVYRMIEITVTNDYIKYKERIDSEVERYNNLWNKYNDKYFGILFKIS